MVLVVGVAPLSTNKLRPELGETLGLAISLGLMA